MSHVFAGAKISATAAALAGVVTPGPDFETYLLTVVALAVPLLLVWAGRRATRLSPATDRWAAIVETLPDDGPPVVRSVAPGWHTDG